MKKLPSFILLLLLTFNLFAAIHSVTLNNDDVNSPVVGMLRYAVINANAGDTIFFEVDSVGLLAEIRISNKSITIDGGKGIILDAGKNGRVFNISFDSYTHIFIKNITIQNGLIDDSSLAWGGGMYVSGSGDGLLVENCSFISNIANTNTGDGQGGALRTQDGIYKNCFFINNAVTGTGLSNSGGAVMAIGGKFINCVFAGNSGKFGGGIYATNSSTFTNCTATQNIAPAGGDGAGIYCETESKFINCIVYNNKLNNIEQNIVNSQNTSIFSYCAIESGNSLVGTNNNIGLTETPFTHSGVDSLALKKESKCIDKGSPNISDYPKFDIIGNSRIDGIAIDIGAYEFFIPIVINGFIKQEEGIVLQYYNLYQNITTSNDGTFIINQGGIIKKGDTLILNAAPSGYEFYPKKIVVDQTKSINIIAYKGIVIDGTYPAGIDINWTADTVNVFTDIIVDSCSLSIASGTKVKFHKWLAIKISRKGKIIAKGTKEKPIIFIPADTSGYSYDDYWDITGAWHGIRFYDVTTQDTSILEYCTLQNGKASSRGGSSEPQYGGVIYAHTYNDKFNLKFTNCKILNSINTIGGGVFLRGVNAILTNCIFYNNKVGPTNAVGGALYIADSDVTLINCNVINNKVDDKIEYRFGGGICAEYSNLKIYNSIIRDNTVEGYLNNIGNRNSNVELYNCNVGGGNNFMSTVYSNCIDADPQFIDTAHHNFALLASSPCINLGDTNRISNFLPQTDLAGNIRVMGKTVDIGAFEFKDVSLYIVGDSVTYTNTKVQFKGKVSLRNVSAWSWDFNGDNIEDSDIQEPNYTFLEEGEFKVSLIATITEIGAADTAYFFVNVKQQAPIASFKANATKGGAPLTIQFTDESLQTPKDWQWNFGDGNSSKEQNPEHTYNDIGIYTVKLTVKNNGGSNSLTLVDFIEVIENTSINNLEKDNIVLFPNPTKNILHISTEEFYEIRLLNISGNILLDKIMTSKTESIDLIEFPMGMYFIFMMNNNNTFVKKIIKD